MNVLTACLILTVTAHISSARSLLPHPVRTRDIVRANVAKHHWINHANVHKSFNTDFVDVYPYENLPFRRKKYRELDDESPTFFDDESPKFFDGETPVYLDEETANILKRKKHNPPLVKSSKNINKRLYKNEKKFGSDKTYEYDNLFDENGMLFLTKPVDAQDRKLNKLMNKVVEYNMNSKKNKFLRQPLTMFKSEEVKELENIVRSLDEEESDEEDVPINIRTEYEFNELVQ